MYIYGDSSLSKTRQLVWSPGFAVTTTSRRFLASLHRLPVRQGVVFKTAVLLWKCLHGVAPRYLFRLPLRRVVSVYALRRRASWWFHVLGRQSASGVLRYKDRQHGTVCWHRCGHRTWHYVPSGVNWRCISGLSTVDRRHWDSKERKVIF